MKHFMIGKKVTWYKLEAEGGRSYSRKHFTGIVKDVDASIYNPCALVKKKNMEIIKVEICELTIMD